MRIFFVFLLASLFAQAQLTVLNPNAPKSGRPAPELSFTRLLQAPAGTKADWPSLRGKVVVLEFWATWCAPCVAEIPVLNSLIAATDPAKVQFISVDDEDPALVENFLKKHPISGWLGFDSSGKLFDRFGVNARPTTMVIDPRGLVASTTVRPEQLKAEQLLALAEGKRVTFDGPADEKMQARVQAALDEEMAERKGSRAVFEIILSLGDEKGNMRAMLHGPGQVDISNAPLRLLLSNGAGLPSDRITTSGQMPDLTYDLHVEAPGAEPKRLAEAVELAIASGAHVEIRHSTETEDVYVLTAKPDAAAHLSHASGSGGALYDARAQVLHCLSATPAQLADALESALGTPVLDETGLDGELMTSLKVIAHDAASARDALAGLGFGLEEAKRPVERVIITPAPALAAK